MGNQVPVEGVGDEGMNSCREDRDLAGRGIDWDDIDSGDGTDSEGLEDSSRGHRGPLGPWWPWRGPLYRERGGWVCRLGRESRRGATRGALDGRQRRERTERRATRCL